MRRTGGPHSNCISGQEVGGRRRDYRTFDHRTKGLLPATFCPHTRRRWRLESIGLPELFPVFIIHFFFIKISRVLEIGRIETYHSADTP